jgi:hypothetical protein
MSIRDSGGILADQGATTFRNHGEELRQLVKHNWILGKQLPSIFIKEASGVSINIHTLCDLAARQHG